MLAVVTGASSGSGAEYARWLAGQGFDLALVGRDADRLHAVGDGIRDNGGTVEAELALDLSTDEGVKTVERLIEEAQINWLVDCAALAHYMPFSVLSRTQAIELARLNVESPMRLCLAATRRMRELGGGTIVLFSSMFTFSCGLDNADMPGRAAYAGTKAFVLAFARLVAAEVDGAGIRVQVVCPGAVDSQFHLRQGRATPHPCLTPSQVVKASTKGIAMGERWCVPQLEDGAMLDEVTTLEKQIFQRCGTTSIASRYG